MVDEFPQAQVPGEGGRQGQAGIGHQAMVVKEDADTVGFVLCQHLLGAPCFRAGFCSKTIIPDSEEHPLASSRAVRPSFGGFGLKRNYIETLAISLHAFKESLSLAEKIGERVGAAACAFNLGNAYSSMDAVRDLDQAEHWYRRSLELCPENDRLGRGRSTGALGGDGLRAISGSTRSQAARRMSC